MKKYALFIATAIAFSTSAPLYAATCQTSIPGVNLQSSNTFNGPTFCDKGTTSIKKVNGTLKADHTRFQHELTVNGPFTVSNSTFEKSLKVNGPLIANNTQFQKHIHINGAAVLNHIKAPKIKINGVLVATDSEINKLNIASNKTVLSDSEANEIIVRTSENSKPSEVYLKQKSIVKGNITFKGKKAGIVSIGKDAKFLGKVINGQVTNA